MASKQTGKREQSAETSPPNEGPVANFVSPFLLAADAASSPPATQNYPTPKVYTNSAHPISDEGSKSFSFLKLCKVFEGLQAAANRTQQYNILGALWKSLPRGESFFPYMRLLLPDLDNVRPLFHLKESKLARLYVEVIGLSSKSSEAQKLLHWKDPSRSAVETTNFSDVIYVLLKRKGGFQQVGAATTTAVKEGGGAKQEDEEQQLGEGNRRRGPKLLSVFDINVLLDRIANSSTSAERKDIFIELLQLTSPLEQKWILRIILKSMKIRMTFQSMLYAFHPNALDKYNSTNDLLYVCDSCLEDMKQAVPGSAESGIYLFQPLRPMLASIVTTKRLAAMLERQHVLMEPKYDGERIMIHTDGHQTMYWTRNAKNYTSLYGPKFDDVVKRAFPVGKRPPSASSHNANSSDELQNVILDGEFLLYDSSTGHFTEFGLNRTFANAADAQMAADAVFDSDGKWFCYMVFDMVFLNGESLMSVPLQDRRRMMHNVLEQEATRLEIVPSQPVSSTAEMLKGLERAIEDRKEGIVLKAAESTYVPAERKSQWMKLKMDHIAGLADSMDLIIVGGFYGTKFGQRRLSHFVLAAWDNKSSSAATDATARFHTVCKVGNGYTNEELQTINTFLEAHWETMPNRQTVPSWLDGWRPTNSDLIPDLYVHPSHSIVVEVFGYAFTEESTNYRAGFTVRFPRMLRIRWDKTFRDATDMEQVLKIKKASKDAIRDRMRNGKDELFTVLSLKRKHREDGNAKGEAEEENEEEDKKRKKTIYNPLSLAPRTFAVIKETLNVAALSASEQVIDHLFDGYEFCVLFTSAETASDYPSDVVSDKTSLEKYVLRHGARVAANPTSRTSLLIATSSRAPKVAHWVAMCKDTPSDKLSKAYASTDVVDVKWIFDCVAAEKIIPLSPRYMLYASPALLGKFSLMLDPYCDSFYENCTMDSLRYSLKRAKEEVYAVLHSAEARAKHEKLLQEGKRLVVLSQELWQMRKQNSEGDMVNGNRDESNAALTLPPIIVPIEWKSAAAVPFSTSANEPTEDIQRVGKFFLNPNSLARQLAKLSELQEQDRCQKQHKKMKPEPTAGVTDGADGSNSSHNPYTAVPFIPFDQAYEILPTSHTWSTLQLIACSQKVLQEHACIVTDLSDVTEKKAVILCIDPFGTCWRYR